jgi:uncharacterized protein YraI
MEYRPERRFGKPLAAARWMAGVLFAAVTWMTASAPAVAEPAVAKSEARLREGPGLQHVVLATIPGGGKVDAQSCDGGWCQVTYAGKSGFAYQALLDFGSARPPGEVETLPPQAPQRVVPDRGTISIYREERATRGPAPEISTGPGYGALPSDDRRDVYDPRVNAAPPGGATPARR